MPREGPERPLATTVIVTDAVTSTCKLHVMAKPDMPDQAREDERYDLASCGGGTGKKADRVLARLPRGDPDMARVTSPASGPEPARTATLNAPFWCPLGGPIVEAVRARDRDGITSVPAGDRGRWQSRSDSAIGGPSWTVREEQEQNGRPNQRRPGPGRMRRHALG